MMNLFQAATIQSLLMVPLCLGLYLSYRVLNITDLTVEGSFVLGAAVFARLISLGFNQHASVFVGVIAGCVCGLCVALMQRITKLEPLIVSILALFMLFSINYAVMGRPNISLLDFPLLLQTLQLNNPPMLLMSMMGIAVVCCMGLLYFIGTDTGLLMRAYGANPGVIKVINKNPNVIVMLGMSFSNGLAALSGIMTAEVNGYADVHMGFGVALTAIGAIIVGMTIMQQCRRRVDSYHALTDILGCLAGTFLYFLVLNSLLLVNINPIYLKFFLGLLLLVFLSSGRYAMRRRQV